VRALFPEDNLNEEEARATLIGGLRRLERGVTCLAWHDYCRT